MIYLKNFNELNENSKVESIINYIDLSINESVDINKIWGSTLRKIQGLSNQSKRKVLTYAISALISASSLSGFVNIANASNLEPETMEIVTDVISKEKVKKFKKGYEYNISTKGINNIKEEEKLSLKSYKLGDGMITIGYGHAEPIKTSYYKMGDVITEAEAEKLLKKDLKVAEDGVKRIFKEWESKGIDVPISQEMYDALVSIAFNIGVGGLRTSEMIRHLKKGEYEKAGEKIKNLKTSDNFAGLAIRRLKESELFLSGV
jgi:lysozyme